MGERQTETSERQTKMSERLGELPPFANSLIESGEALAYLHLSGNAVNFDADHQEITYTTTVNEKEVSFTYDVLCSCSGWAGKHGKAVVYRPIHDPDRIVIAFRAVRLAIDAGQISGNSSDVASM